MLAWLDTIGMQRFLRIGKPRRRRLVPVLPALAVRQMRRTALSRMPDMSDWKVGSRFVEILHQLRERPFIHRKAWEYGICIEGLERLGVVTPDAVALSVGAGYERPLFYFANKISRMVATDLYDNPLHEGQPGMLTEPWRYAPFEYRRENLEVQKMSGDALAFGDNVFDFVFCLSSIEHFGSRDTIAKTLAEMKRVLKPGGIACIVTEVIIEGPTHGEYFTPVEIGSIFLSDMTFSLVGGEHSFVIAEELLRMPVDIRDPEDLSVSPHIVLTDGERLWTSFSMFLRKQVVESPM